jgi:hypothetical protein
MSNAGRNRSAGSQPGSAELIPPYEKSVFINCPFDPAFEPLFDAIVFSVVACDFIPRSALESRGVADSRIERIARALLSSRFSIHDLSRCRGEGDESLARFNMPLELGMAMALRLTQATTRRDHDWVALVTEGHSYVRFVADLAGFDLLRHDNTARSMVREILSWLQTLPGATIIPPIRVFEALPAFQAEKSRLTGEGLGRISWANRLLAAARTVPRL